MDTFSSSLRALLENPTVVAPSILADAGLGGDAAPLLLGTLVSELKAAAAHSDLLVAESACRALAELAKDEGARSVLGDEGLVPACCAVMTRAAEAGNPTATTQAARALGNLCFDHAGNRQRVLQCGGVAALAHAMRVGSEGASVDGAGASSSSATATAATASAAAPSSARATSLAGAGAVLNAATDDAELAAGLVQAGVVENLLWLVQRSTEDAQQLHIALAALERFIDSQEAMERLARGRGVPLLLGLIARPPVAAEQAAVAVTNAAEASAASAGTSIVPTTDGAAAAPPALASAHPPRISPEDQDIIFNIVQAVSNHDAMLPHLATDGSLHTLLHLRQDRTLPERVCTAAGLVLSAALSDDKCLEAFLRQEEEESKVSGAGAAAAAAADAGVSKSVAMFVSWIVGSGSDVDLQVSGAICLGNMARSDANCARLLAAGTVVPALCSMAARDTTATQHAALGALKNLANFAPAKALILSSLSGATVLQALHSGSAPIQYLGASLFRSILIHQPADTVLPAVSLPGLLDRLVHLRGSEEIRVRAEASRALLNVVRFGGVGAAQLAVTAGAVPAFVGLMQEEHVLLRNEAAVGLVHCCQVPETRAAMASAGVHSALAKQLRNADDPPQLVCSFLALAITLAAQGAGKDGGDGGSDSTRAGLDEVAVEVARLAETSSDPTVRTQAAAALAVLRGQ